MLRLLHMNREILKLDFKTGKISLNRTGNITDQISARTIQLV